MTSLCGNSRVLRSNSPGFEFRLAASLICPEANYFTSPSLVCLLLTHATGMIVRSFLGLAMTPVRCLFPATGYLQHLLDHQILHQAFIAAADASITPAVLQSAVTVSLLTEKVSTRHPQHQAGRRSTCGWWHYFRISLAHYPPELKPGLRSSFQRENVIFRHCSCTSRDAFLDFLLSAHKIILMFKLRSSLPWNDLGIYLRVKGKRL